MFSTELFYIFLIEMNLAMFYSHGLLKIGALLCFMASKHEPPKKKPNPTVYHVFFCSMCPKMLGDLVAKTSVVASLAQWLGFNQ